MTQTHCDASHERFGERHATGSRRGRCEGFERRGRLKQPRDCHRQRAGAITCKVRMKTNSLIGVIGCSRLSLAARKCREMAQGSGEIVCELCSVGGEERRASPSAVLRAGLTHSVSF